jgi:hypothetical protein
MASMATGCVLLAACAGGSAAPADQNAVTVVSTVDSVISAPTPPPLREEVTVDIVPALSSSQCPQLSAAPVPPKPATFGDTAAALRDYLSAGATLEDASAAMQAWGVKFAAPQSNEPLGSIEFAKILGGEDQQIVATMFDPAPGESVARAGDLAVYRCANGRYEIAYQALTDVSFEGFVTDPRVLSVDDVTGDGIYELSFLTGDCSAATCMDGVTILSAHGGGALRNLAPDFAYVPFPSFEYVPGATGAKDLVVAEGILGDASAGPQRGVTTTWTFVGGIYTRTAEAREPAVYRIHALHDGDDALRRQDYRQADASFGQVVNDPTLQAWDANPNIANEQQILGAFAYVRLIQSSALRGDTVGAQAAYDSLMRFAPADSPGYLYAQIGEAFYKSWIATQNIGQACAAAVQIARQNPNTALWLGVDSFGSANYDYQPEDMCVQ